METTITEKLGSAYNATSLFCAETSDGALGGQLPLLKVIVARKEFQDMPPKASPSLDFALPLTKRKRSVVSQHQ